ncbi:MAG TPA: hypothetical protein VFX20_15985 [Steroidobacteraceae bacterium]|nr:hypothetical protein [Steroidobacteraceae bacterium]
MARLKADKVPATPAYPLIEAAHYLNLPLSTLRAWCLGQPLRADAKTRRFEHLIRLDGDQRRALSFLNLVEAHVLAAIRHKHHIPLPVVVAPWTTSPSSCEARGRSPGCTFKPMAWI